MYREVRMVEITEVLPLWRAGVAKKRIAARLGLDPKTVRRYVTVAEGTGLHVGDEAMSDTQLRDVLWRCIPVAAVRGATTGTGVASSRRRFAAG